MACTLCVLQLFVRRVYLTSTRSIIADGWRDRRCVVDHRSRQWSSDGLVERFGSSVCVHLRVLLVSQRLDEVMAVDLVLAYIIMEAHGDSLVLSLDLAILLCHSSLDGRQWSSFVVYQVFGTRSSENRR